MSKPIRPSECRVLMVGAGGIGCELLKNLLLSGFVDIEVVDLDTIDLSNLNRQFLFRNKHIGQSKAKVACESASSFNPKAKLIPHHKNIITDELFTVEYFKSFDIIMNALDNLAARRHVNKMCLAANVPLLESGTAGLLGQVSAHIKGVTECFDCVPKETPKVFPVCTIRSTPSLPIHCIVWGKYLFSQLFGNKEELEDPPEVDSTVGDSEEIKKLNEESQSLKRLRELAGTAKHPLLVFEKIFNSDIKRLAENEDAFKNRAKPVPFDYKLLEQLTDDKMLSGIDIDHKIWSTKKCFDVFLSSCLTLGKESLKKDLYFSKDNTLIMDFVTAASNLRSIAFGIPTQSRFQIKEMAGNIIPAISTTNAIIAGLMVLLSFQVLKFQNGLLKLKGNLKTTYLNYENPQNILQGAEACKPSPNCHVCSSAYFQIRVGTGSATLGSFLEDIVKSKFQMMGDVDILRGDSDLLYDPDFEDNLDKTFKDLNLINGQFLTVSDTDDETGDKVNVVLFIVSSDEEIEFELTGDLPIPFKKRDTGKQKKRELEPEEHPLKKSRTEIVIESDVNGNDVLILD